MNLVINSQFKPFSYQELYTPIAQATQQHQQTDASITELQAKAAEIEHFLKAEQDQSTYEQYKGFYDKLQAMSDDLAMRGLSPQSMRDILKMKVDYNQSILPMQMAIQKRMQEVEEQKKTRLQDPTMLFSYDAQSRGIKDYMQNLQDTYRTQSLTAVHNDMAKLAERISREIMMNDVEWERILGTNKMQSLIQIGASSDDILKFLNNEATSNSELADKLSTMMGEVLTRHDISRWENLSEVNQKALRDALGSGAWYAVGTKQPHQTGTGERMAGPTRVTKETKEKNDELDDIYLGRYGENYYKTELSILQKNNVDINNNLNKYYQFTEDGRFTYKSVDKFNEDYEHIMSKLKELSTQNGPLYENYVKESGELLNKKIKVDFGDGVVRFIDKSSILGSYVPSGKLTKRQIDTLISAYNLNIDGKKEESRKQVLSVIRDLYNESNKIAKETTDGVKVNTMELRLSHTSDTQKAIKHKLSSTNRPLPIMTYDTNAKKFVITNGDNNIPMSDLLSYIEIKEEDDNENVKIKKDRYTALDLVITNKIDESYPYMIKLRDNKNNKIVYVGVPLDNDVKTYLEPSKRSLALSDALVDYNKEIDKLATNVTKTWEKTPRKDNNGNPILPPIENAYKEKIVNQMLNIMTIDDGTKKQLKESFMAKDTEDLLASLRNQAMLLEHNVRLARKNSNYGLIKSFIGIQPEKYKAQHD